MAPLNLKIGDTFDEVDFGRVFRQKIIAFDSEGRYISECIGEVRDGELAVQPTVEEPKTEEPKTEDTPVEDEDADLGELPFTTPGGELDEEQPTAEDEEQPTVEEPKEEKKTAPKKNTKKKTTKRTAKK